MEDIEIVSTIKTRDPNPQGMSEVFSDRMGMKLKNEKWKNFPACILSKTYLDYHPTVKNFKVYEDDVWMCGFPRSGTTIMQELLWLIVNNYDFEGAKASDTYNRANWFE